MSRLIIDLVIREMNLMDNRRRFEANGKYLIFFKYYPLTLSYAVPSSPRSKQIF